MPGKVNPTQCEAVTMVCAQVRPQDEPELRLLVSYMHRDLDLYFYFAGLSSCLRKTVFFRSGYLWRVAVKNRAGMVCAKPILNI